MGSRNWSRQSSVRRKGTKFWEKEIETKVYLALLLVQLHLHVLHVGFLSHFPFPKTFSLENVFH